MRLKAQCLHPRASPGEVADVVRSVCGVNAQARPAMMLSLRARIRGAELQNLSDMINSSRTLVRTWAMRGTVHLLTREDADLILPLVSPGIVAKHRGRRRQLGLDEEKLATGLAKVTAILDREGPLTRDALVERLNGHGFAIDRKSQAVYHLIVYASLKRLIVLGPDSTNGEQTYVLAGEPTGKPKPKEEALAELAGRYFKGYAPATAVDFAAWSGLPAADAGKGWELLRERGLMPEDTEPELTETVVNLIPAFDTLLLGYSDRSLIVPAKRYADVYHGGQVVPTVLADGEAKGVWRYEIKGRKIGLEIRPFEKLDRRVKDLVETEAGDVGRFFGREPEIEWR